MANTNSEIKLLSKNTELNNILKDYSIVASDNSYILSYYANLYSANYSKIEYLTDPSVISEFLTLDTDNRINNFSTSFQEKINFNYETSYVQSGKILEPNSLIISNLTDETNTTTYTNSYLVFYNTSCGLKQLTYHYKEGNGFYYDQQYHIFGMNIDNDCIKEINKRLFFDTNSIPISSQENYGIAYIDNKYLRVNNGVLTIDQKYIENVISYKYKIKNLFDSLSNIYDSLSYYNNIYNTKDNALDEFSEAFSVVSEIDSEGNFVSKTIKTEISYHNTTSLYFPKNEIKYIDDYYFSNGLIGEKYKQFIELNDNNSYIIYCKDLEKIEIYSYIENEYINYGKVFNVNKLRNIESQLDNSSIIDISTLDQETDYTQYIENNNRQEILNSNNIYSYIYIDESNNYNKFIVKPNIITKQLFSKPKNLIEVTNNSQLVNNDNILIFVQKFYNDIEYYEQVNSDYVENNMSEKFFTCEPKDAVCYQMTKNKINYHNTLIDQKLFKQLGIILNSKISLPKINKNIIEYVKNDKAIKYDYTIQHITCRYNDRNIKVLYDDRQITYCTYNTNPIPYNKDNYYFLSDYNNDTRVNIDNALAFMLKNIDISFDNRLKYLFYGCSWVRKNENMYNKNYHAIWNDLPTCFITSNFMKIISSNAGLSGQRGLLLNNFKELYTENFNELEFYYNESDESRYKTLYLYKLYKSGANQYIEKVNNITINI